MRFPAKKNAGCPKALRDFTPRKDGISTPARVGLGLPPPLTQSLYGRTYADVTTKSTKLSGIDRLPNLFRYGALLARCTRGPR